MINSEFYSKEALRKLDKAYASDRESCDIHPIAYPFDYNAQIDSTVLEKSEAGNKLLQLVKEYFQSGIAPQEYSSFEKIKASVADTLKKGACLSLCQYVAAAAQQNPERPFSAIVQATVNDRFTILALQGAYHVKQDLLGSIKLYDYLATLDGVYQKYIFSEKPRSLKKITCKLQEKHKGPVVDTFKKMYKFCKKRGITQFSDPKFQTKKNKEGEKAFSKEFGPLDPPLSHLRTITSPAKRKTADELVASLTKMRQDFLGLERKVVVKNYCASMDKSKEIIKLDRKVERFLQGNTPGELRFHLRLKKYAHAISVIQTKQGMYYLDQNLGAFEAKDREKFITFIRERILSGNYYTLDEVDDCTVKSLDAWVSFA